ncbi:MAG: hypothetical protein K1V80_03745 [Muribaculaceae bacterium]
MLNNSGKNTHTLMLSLWTNWAIAFGFIAIVLILSRFVPKIWLPFPVFILAYLELIVLRRRTSFSVPGSTVMLSVSVLTLFWSSMVMLGINILNAHPVFEQFIDKATVNKQIPYITSLIVFPVMIIMSLWVMLRNTSLLRNGVSTSANNVITSLYRRESHYQVQLMLFISAGMSAVEWWYYFNYYINVNMNTPDVFFFTWMPVALYIFSLYFVWNRCGNIAAVIGPIAYGAKKTGTIIRYIVLSDDRMLLTMNEHDRWDTPAVTQISKFDNIGEEAAKKAFENISGCKDFELRYLYETSLSDILPQMKHYAAFVKAEDYPAVKDHGTWFTLDQLDRMIKTARLSAELTDEIYRIFTITMAWKTYDTEGRRLYPIKHYRPTFRLRDLKSWTVDYNDVSWFAIANNNQDRPFFRTRRFWHKITGSKF